MGIALVVDPDVLAIVDVDIDIAAAFVHIDPVPRIVDHLGPVDVSVSVSIGCLRPVGASVGGDLLPVGRLLVSAVDRFVVVGRSARSLPSCCLSACRLSVVGCRAPIVRRGSGCAFVLCRAGRCLPGHALPTT